MSYFCQFVTCSSSQNNGISTLGINQLMERYLLDDKVLRVSFGNDVQYEADTWKVELSEVRVIGLSSFKIGNIENTGSTKNRKLD